MKKYGTFGVKLKWWYAFLPPFIVKVIVKVELISTEGIETNGVQELENKHVKDNDKPITP